MQAEGDMPNMARPTEAPAMPPRPAAPNPMTQGPANEKKSNGMLIGLILCIVIALGGIGFGVWAMMDGNTQVNSLNDQISNLKQQNNSLQEQLDNGGDEYSNPIIQSSGSDEEYRVWLSSSIVDGKEMRIGVKDGQVDICSIYETSGAFVGDCAIEGVSGDIFNVVEFGQGQDNSNSNIGFIMADGSVYYFPFVEAMKNNEFVIKGKLNVDGFVIDVIEITAGPTEPGVAGGYGSTVFVLKDGTFVKFDETMLN